MRKLLLTALMLIGLLVATGPASATDFCVAPNTTCGGTNVGDLQTALDWAGLSDNADRIFLGAATYTAPLGGYAYDVQTGPVEIAGAGQGSTILTAPATGDQHVLSVMGGAGSSIHHLRMEMPAGVATYATGLVTNGTVDHVTVADAAVEPNPYTGVVLEGGATLSNSVVGLNHNAQSTGAVVEAGGNVVSDTIVGARDGIESFGSATIERSWLGGADYGVIAHPGKLSITSSIVTSANPNGVGVYAGAAATQGVAVHLDGVDIIGNGEPASRGIWANNTGGSTASVAVDIDNTLIRGFPSPLRAESASLGTGSVSIGAQYSDYDGSGNAVVGAHSTIAQTNVSNVGDGSFGPDGYGDLLPGSPLIDAGDPATPQGLDFGGKALVTDGNGDGIARRDIGAIESPAVTPPASASNTQPAASPTGASGGSGGSTPAPAVTDTQPPLVSGLSLTHKSFAVGRTQTALAALVRGTRLRYKLSEKATVIVRIAHGKRGVGKLVRHSAAGANTVAFSGRIGRRALKPGRYIAIVTATDAAGNKSLPKRLAFRIIGR